MKKLPQKIVKLLSKKKLKISFAESCTGGLLSCAITSVSGSSKVFALGLVTYSNQSKNNILKIPKKTLIKYGAVSYESSGTGNTQSRIQFQSRVACIQYPLRDDGTGVSK